MSTDSGPEENRQGVQKISLPPQRDAKPLSLQPAPRKKPGWLLPVGLLVFLILGFLLIFLLKPGKDEAHESESVEHADSQLEETTMDAAAKPFVQISLDKLRELKVQAEQAVKAQADRERLENYQRVLYGKAVFLWSDAEAAYDRNEWPSAQRGYEAVLETVNTLQESYRLAEELSTLKHTIEKLVSTLQNKAANLLDASGFQSIQSDLAKADDLLQAGDLNPALDLFRQSEANLQALVKQGEEQFQSALKEGLKALNAGDGETATRHLTVAQGLRPEDPFVARQLERAAVIDRVFEHYHQGLKFEEQGLQASARVEYQKALELDPDSVNINARLHAINQSLNRELFKEALAAGLKALTAGKGDAAVEQLEKASALMPANAEARNALEEARELQRRQRVDRWILQGKEALAKSDWATARNAFQQALDYQPASQEAQEGLRVAEETLMNEEQVKQFLVEAETFERNGEFEKALIVLREGRQIADPSGAITEKIKHLEGILEEQSKPQPVRILSDGYTDIQIYKVGKFKPSTQIDLELRPGEYTVVGSRLMYRDVRYTLRIEVGESPSPLEVICRERL